MMVVSNMAANVKVKAKLHHNSMEMEIFRDVHVKILVIQLPWAHYMA